MIETVEDEMWRVAGRVLEQKKEKAMAFLRGEKPGLVRDVQKLDHNTLIMCARALFDQGMFDAAGVVVHLDLLVQAAQELPREEAIQ